MPSVEDIFNDFAKTQQGFEQTIQDNNKLLAEINTDTAEITEILKKIQSDETTFREKEKARVQKREQRLRARQRTQGS